LIIDSLPLLTACCGGFGIQSGLSEGLSAPGCAWEFFAKENVYALDRATVSYQKAHHCHAASGCTENALFYQSGVRQESGHTPSASVPTPPVRMWMMR
jgi:hypothetical protein